MRVTSTGLTRSTVDGLYYGDELAGTKTRSTLSTRKAVAGTQFLEVSTRDMVQTSVLDIA